MNRLIKPGVVLAGYAAALLVACAAVHVRELRTGDDLSQASGGMQAFADVALFVAVFGVVALAPTALALYFLRHFPQFWIVLSLASLALAATGPLGAAVIRLHESPWPIVGILGLHRVLVAPLLALGFLVCAAMAPARRSRGALLAAALIEGTVSAYAFLCLFVLQHWLF
jgi:hypothetical protein